MWIGRWNFLNLDQGIEAFSTISLKNDWPFLDMTLRVEPFFNMTHRIEPFKKNMIHRDWTLLYNMTRNWVHFLVWVKRFFFTKCMTQLNWSFLENMTQRIEIFVRKRTLRIEPFSKIYFKNCTFIVLKKKKKRSNNCLLLRNITRWIESFFHYYSKTWAFFLIIWPSRIEPFWKIWLKGLNFLSVI